MAQTKVSQKVVIIGGVAGGASCAARLRRLDENAQIILVERGPFISFANCGLPYHISGTISDREKLLVTTKEKFSLRFNLQVMTETEALHIDRANRYIRLCDRQSGKTWQESYDKLVLSPGAEPIRPPQISGVDHPKVLTLRNIPDLDRIMNQLSNNKIKKAVVIGAGFIGIETAENLVERGIEVTLVEKADQVMPLMDREMSALLEAEMRAHHINILTSKGVTSIRENSDQTLLLHLDDNSDIACDLVILSIGVRPETQLAQQADLAIGPQGGIVVDQQMCTSDPNIFAVGDAVEIQNRITGLKQRIPLAGPANRQGRLVADVIAGRSKCSYPGALGTSIVKVFNLAAASVGLSEKQARNNISQNYQVAWVHGKSHASYYPDAKPMLLKVLFAPETGRIVGAQAVGQEGIDKRMDVLATAVYAQMTVFDLEWLDLSYAPPFSSAKDPVNQLGSIAANMLRQDHPSVRWYEVGALVAKGDHTVIDVRSPSEIERLGSLSGAINIPLDELRSRLNEIPTSRPILIYCEEGLRGYLATRILMQKGYQVRNLLGGHKLFRLVEVKS